MPFGRGSIVAMGRAVLFLCAALIILLGGFFAWNWYNAGNTSFEGVETPDFSEEGKLTKGNPGASSPVWHLTYEKAGAPGLVAPLSFSADTVCIREDIAERCDLTKLGLGDKVSIVGKKSDTGVDVWALTFLDPVASQ